jgi:hypothetical protein
VFVDQIIVPSPSLSRSFPSLVKFKMVSWLTGLSGLAGQMTGAWEPKSKIESESMVVRGVEAKKDSV